jgi:hypothetical protein
MPEDTAFDDPWDEETEPVDEGPESGLDTYEDYEWGDEDAETLEDDWNDLGPTQKSPTGVETLLFTATNPTGAVSATVLMSGRVLDIALSPRAEELTEAQLAAEITAISAVARRQALAGQHVVVANLMASLGHDRNDTRSFLERELGLPTPETVISERAAIFATRYREDAE